MMVYTLTEAAKAVGRTRQALQMAIKKGTISATKDGLGQWTIDPAELHRVYKPVKAASASNDQNFHPLDAEKGAQIREMQARLDVMQQLVATLETQVSDIRRERDDWKQQADEWRLQVRALPAPEAPAAHEVAEAGKRRGPFWWLWPWSSIA